MSRRSKAEEAARLERLAAGRPPLVSLLAVDASIFDHDGIAIHLGVLPDGKHLIEQAFREAEDGKDLRQAFLDLGARHLGTPPLNLARAFPSLLTPSSFGREARKAFYDQVQEQVRGGKVLLLGSHLNLLLVETAVIPFDHPSPDDLRVVAGPIPGRYACLVRRSPELHGAVGGGDEEFQRALCYDLGEVGDRARVLETVDDPAEAKGRMAEAMVHLHAHLAISLLDMWKVFGGGAP
ncbi:MAG: hypothetical protein ACYCPN_06900 [Thermoplasmata archaeon]